jgi:hypothetical protein
MVRSAGEVQADIAEVKQVIERDLDALHGHLPRRGWVAYAWLGVGVGVGLVLSRAPLTATLGGVFRAAELGMGVIVTLDSWRRRARSLEFPDTASPVRHENGYPGGGRRIEGGRWHMKEGTERQETMVEPLADAAHRAVAVGRDATSRTTEYVRDGLGRVADYAHGLTAKASDQIAELTGRPPEAWSRELRRLVEQHPLQSLLVTVGLGYALGKVIRRG